ncbi:hypothetical protein EVAR_103524_1 [Eumeta japonica]|uniref:Uncharacterized protein n=1 Tax=Eumeta variegata TaxID=151549 RepID=A0A4C1YSI1_EUMVA|nr:hypothetical protein EVAR_103524_1 [Eumeta japonica]
MLAKRRDWRARRHLSCGPERASTLTIPPFIYLIAVESKDLRENEIVEIVLGRAPSVRRPPRDGHGRRGAAANRPRPGHRGRDDTSLFTPSRRRLGRARAFANAIRQLTESSVSAYLDLVVASAGRTTVPAAARRLAQRRPAALARCDTAVDFFDTTAIPCDLVAAEVSNHQATSAHDDRVHLAVRYRGDGAVGRLLRLGHRV